MNLPTQDYAAIYEGLRNDLKNAKARHAEAMAAAEREEQAVINLRQSLVTIGNLCGQVFEEEDEYGLTDQVRLALKTWNGGPLMPPDLLARIANLGYPQKSDNALVSIHTILKRLLVKGEVDTVTVQPGNKTGYVWARK